MRGKRSEIPVHKTVVKRMKILKDTPAALEAEKPAPSPTGKLPADVPDVTQPVTESVTEDVTETASDLEWREADPTVGAAGSDNVGDGTNGRTDTEGETARARVCDEPGHLAAGMRDSMLQLIMRQEKPWVKLPEHQQKILADEVFQACKVTVQDAIAAILEIQPVHVDVRVDKIGIDKEIKVLVSAANVSANVSKLAGAWHKAGILVMLSPDDFTTWVKPETLPDQPGLDLGAGAQMEDA